MRAQQRRTLAGRLWSCRGFGDEHGIQTRGLQGDKQYYVSLEGFSVLFRLLHVYDSTGLIIPRFFPVVTRHSFTTWSQLAAI